MSVGPTDSLLKFLCRDEVRGERTGESRILLKRGDNGQLTCVDESEFGFMERMKFFFQ